MPKQNLAGCNNVGSRPLQHLHIDEILRGDESVRLRRWVYGIEEAAADFICRNCVFARER